jgi:hypothetical protein
MKRASDSGRKDRLAEALKENLKRRKAQARQRATRATVPPAPTPGAALEERIENVPQSGLKSAPNCQ